MENLFIAAIKDRNLNLYNTVIFTAEELNNIRIQGLTDLK